jgi:preprotein translocase subunit SecA
MEAEDLQRILTLMIEDYIDNAVEQFIDPSELPENWPLGEFSAQLEGVFLHAFPLPEVESIEDYTVGEVRDNARDIALEAMNMREASLSRELGGDDQVRSFERFVLLQNIDEKWMDHLHELDSLKEGIHYRAYAQRNPLVEYKKEAFELFAQLNERIDQEALYMIFHARVSAPRKTGADLARARAIHKETGAYSMTGQEQQATAAASGGAMGTTAATNAALKQKAPTAPVVRNEVKVGRNDPCPCGSGKKHKKCCGTIG